MNGASETYDSVIEGQTFMASECLKNIRGEMYAENTVEETRVENLPILAKDINLQIQECEQISNRVNPKIHAKTNC